MLLFFKNFLSIIQFYLFILFTLQYYIGFAMLLFLNCHLEYMWRTLADSFVIKRIFKNIDLFFSDNLVIILIENCMIPLLYVYSYSTKR